MGTTPPFDLVSKENVKYDLSIALLWPNINIKVALV